MEHRLRVNDGKTKGGKELSSTARKRVPLSFPFALTPTTASDPFREVGEWKKKNHRKKNHSLPLADDAQVEEVPGAQVASQRRHRARWVFY